MSLGNHGNRPVRGPFHGMTDAFCGLAYHTANTRKWMWF